MQYVYFVMRMYVCIKDQIKILKVSVYEICNKFRIKRKLIITSFRIRILINMILNSSNRKTQKIKICICIIV